MQYRDLAIPGNQESRFTGVCDLSIPHGLVSLQPLDLRLHYILPHYHYLGNYFDVSVIGGQHDGESVFRMTGFNGEGNGRAFDPPLALSGATGLRFTCGYDNWRDKDIGWGIGDQEMCVMLGLADSRAIMDMSVPSGSQVVGEDGEVLPPATRVRNSAARSVSASAKRVGAAAAACKYTRSPDLTTLTASTAVTY